ncbi:HAD family phosphatase [archaeon]|nr:HAD family phosphatase [archaeon]
MLIMIKVIAIDLGGVYFKWDYDVYPSEISKVSGINKHTVKRILNKKIRDVHVKRMSEKNYWKYFCKSIGKDIDYKIYRKITLSQYKPNRAVINIVKRLKKHYKITLLANQTPILDKIDSKYKLYKDFDFNLSSHIVKMQKPYKNIYRLLVKKSKCRPEEILFIDDKNRNLKPAKELGINTILFKNATQLKKDLGKFGISVR